MDKWNGQERRAHDNFDDIKDAAKQGVYEALTEITGVDVSTHEGRKALSSDFEYLHIMHDSCDRMKKTATSTVIVTIVSAFFVIIGLGAKEWLHKD
jgi:hypothetical protein